MIVDDEKLIRWSLRQRLEESGHTVVEAANGQEALTRFEEGVDLVLLDWLLPDENGLEVFRRMRALDPTPPVIMLTAHTSVPRAVEVIKEGIFHYAGKPFDLDEVMRTVRSALESSKQRFAISTIRGQVTLEHLIGESALMAELKTRLHRMAKSSASVILVQGERGTGKTLVARALHGSSQLADGPIHTVPCNQVPEDELERELFGEGTTRGLIERCDGGTLVIDDFADIPPAVQARLLRFLEDRRFRRVNGGGDRSAQVRLIFTTSADLSSAVGRKVLRDDLFRKISLLSAELPPLRHRDGDIPLLTRGFIEHFNAQFERDVRGPTGEALQLLESNPWLGNVR
ncbi:MAG: sigma 54-interacting transcriptional regulator, partial [Myxococcota bacterium]